jgi:hypothetical protein
MIVQSKIENPKLLGDPAERAGAGRQSDSMIWILRRGSVQTSILWLSVDRVWIFVRKWESEP